MTMKLHNASSSLIARIFLQFYYLLSNPIIDVAAESHSFILPQICQGNNEGDHDFTLEQIKTFIHTGQFSRARQLAYECLLLLSNGPKDSSANFLDNGSQVYGVGLLVNCCPSTDEIIGTYKSAANALFDGNDNFLKIIEDASRQINSEYQSSGKTAMPCSDERQSFDEISVEVDPFSINDRISGDKSSTTPGSIAIEEWNKCCSYFGTTTYNEILVEAGTSVSVASSLDSCSICCEIAKGSSNHLVLPALREPQVQIQLELRNFVFKDDKWLMEGEHLKEVLEIGQEGALRMYDVAGVLWPAGYLLGLCVSDPIACGIPEALDALWSKLNNNADPIAIELGAGVGFPSISLAKSMNYHKRGENEDNSRPPAIIAADKSKASCGLIIENSYRNGVGEKIKVVEADHMNDFSLSMLRQKSFPSADEKDSQDGFNLVLGSSLQGLFDGTSRHDAKLWRSLDALLSTKDPNAVAVLSHVRSGNERIEVPKYVVSSDGDEEKFASFECIRRISGDRFAMKTRDGNPSDFEIILLRRRRVTDLVE